MKLFTFLLIDKWFTWSECVLHAGLIGLFGAGTFGTMGVGPAFAIAAAVYCRDHEPGKRVVCVEGDSAIGFSAMEIETMLR